MPLAWSQVTSRLDRSRYNLRTVPALLSKQKTDPFGPLFSDAADLERSLAMLAEVISCHT
jgi:DNA primase